MCGILASDMDRVIGQTATAFIKAGTHIEWKDIA
ncbi:MAG: hypothetical protein IKY98_02480 [Alphaproteobacteria bacterium]|nr:hypothetical protein [Alphaproteobacteria bacterium]